MSIALIVAMGENRVIGVDNRIPWRLPADLKRFRQITLGKPVIMGRRTHESIGRPLPGRKNIVVSGNACYRSEGCVVVHSLEQALAAAGAAAEIMVIGGAALYRACLPRACRLYLTLVHQEFDGDTYFPELDWTLWRETARDGVHEDTLNGLRYSFVDLNRIAPPC